MSGVALSAMTRYRPFMPQRRKALARKSLPKPPPSDPVADRQGDDTLPRDIPQLQPQDGIPAHVWHLIQQSGEVAAQRLLDVLQSNAFVNYAPSAKKALIELAMTRAYGLPVRRSVEVKLSSDDADAVAASISALRDSLPERSPMPRDVTPEAEPPEDD